MRDPLQARFFTWRSLQWMIRNRAFTPYFLKRYWRFFWFKMRYRHVVTRGFVFLGKRIEIEVDPHLGRLELGQWTHIGNDNKLRVHNGSLRIGDKVVLGSDNVINAHLDIEVGAATLISDWVYICDFDHAMHDIATPIKDQGLLTSPVRIGPGSWIGTKVTVLRGTLAGTGCVFAANSVVRGTIADGAVMGGVPARELKNRNVEYDSPAQIARRQYLARTAREQRDARGAIQDDLN